MVQWSFVLSNQRTWPITPPHSYLTCWKSLMDMVCHIRSTLTPRLRSTGKQDYCHIKLFSNPKDICFSRFQADAILSPVRVRVLGQRWPHVLLPWCWPKGTQPLRTRLRWMRPLTPGNAHALRCEFSKWGTGQIREIKEPKRFCNE